MNSLSPLLLHLPMSKETNPLSTSSQDFYTLSMGHLYRHHGRWHRWYLDWRCHLEAPLLAQEGGSILTGQESRTSHRLRSEPLRRWQGHAHALGLSAGRASWHVCGCRCECVWGEAKEKVLRAVMRMWKRGNNVNGFVEIGLGLLGAQRLLKPGTRLVAAGWGPLL